MQVTRAIAAVVHYFSIIVAEYEPRLMGDKKRLKTRDQCSWDGRSVIIRGLQKRSRICKKLP